MLQVLKKWMLPLAMVTGALLHDVLAPLAFITPLLVAIMLLFTFCRLSPKDMRIRPLHFWMIGFQICVSVIVYMLLAPWNHLVAQGALICIIAPTAASAAAVTGMLGGDIAFLAGYVLLCNIAVAFAAPIVFSFVGTNSVLPFWTSVLLICRQVMPILLGPLLLAWGLRLWAPKIHAWLYARPTASFYVWSCSLTIVMAKATSFVLAQDKENYHTEILLACTSFLICCLQFAFGKFLGSMYHDRISAGQGMGQKNTVLAIWMSFTYTDPLASIAPSGYIVWQNIINAWQIWRKQVNDARQASKIEN